MTIICNMPKLVLLTLLAPHILADDPCKRLNSASFCLTWGMCTPPLTVSCNEAYALMSQRLLILISDPPLVAPIPRSMLALVNDAARNRQRGVRPIMAIHIASHNDQINLITLIGKLSTKIMTEYPTLNAPIDELKNLVAASVNVKLTILKPLVDAKDYRTLFLYKRAFLAEPKVTGFTYMMQLFAKYISSTDQSIRVGVFANFVPLLHAWLQVTKTLELPDPFAEPLFLDILTEASRFDPIYSDDDKTWSFLLPATIDHLVLPVLPLTAPDDFPLTVTDLLTIDDSLPTIDKINMIIQQLADAINLTFHKKIKVVRAAFYYLLNFPGISLEYRGYFCDQSRLVWGDLLKSFSAPQSVLESHNAVTQIDLFRICGSSYLSVEERVTRVLPIVLAGSRTMSVRQEYSVGDTAGNLHIGKMINELHRMCVSSLRRDVQLKLNETTKMSQNPEILSQFLSWAVPRACQQATSYLDNQDSSLNNRTASALVLTVIGEVIALLVLEGDPNYVLQPIIANMFTPSLYMNSIHVRQGFCKVLDCNVFETVFAESEIVQMIESLRLNKNILKFAGDIIAIT